MLPYHCVNAYPARVSDGSYQKLISISPWLTDNDIWVTGWNVILMPYPFTAPRVSCNLLMGQVSEGQVPNDSPCFNFAAFGGNGGEFSLQEPDFDFQFPFGKGIFMPGIGRGVQRNLSLFGIFPAGQNFQAFLTMRYQLATEVENWTEPKVKTFYAGAPQEVAFLIVQTPWESFPTTILGVDLALDQGKAISMHVCNSASPDILKNVGYHKRSLNYWTPPGVGVPFPAEGGQFPPHIDCHISVDPSFDTNHHVYMLVYYEPQS